MKVLIVDDHEVVREGLATLLTADGSYEVVGSAATGEQALRLAVKAQPDVVLLDFRLPDASGSQVCRALRKLSPNIVVVVLTSYGGDGAIRAATTAGAAGFVTKGAGLTALREVLDKAVRRSSDRPVVVHARGSDHESTTVSTQDRELLELAARGLSDREIARDLHLAESTVRFHLQKLKGKLGATSKTGLVATALRTGIISLDENDMAGA